MSKQVIAHQIYPFADSSSSLLHVKYKFNPLARYKEKVLIIPGGSFSRIVLAEGYDAARWFLFKGYDPYVLNYRHSPNNDLSDAWMDIEHSITFLKNDNRFGIVSFSAGSYILMSYLNENKTTIQNINYLILGYPVLSMTDSNTHVYTRQNVFKDTLSASWKKRLSIEQNWKYQSLPVFIFHSENDPIVPFKASEQLYSILNKSILLRNKNISHGIPLMQKNNFLPWTDTLETWLKTFNNE